MIKSKKGQEMFNSVSPIYEQNEIMESIFEAIGTEADMSVVLSDDILLQLFPQTATWGLDIWEQRLGLITNHNEDIKIRRAKIMAKLQSRYVINPNRMACMIQNFTNGDIEIQENVTPYVFEVDILSEDGFLDDLKDLYSTVKRTKPSHLGVKYKLININKGKLNIGATHITGEEITVYPYVAKTIETKVTININSAQATGAENITTYPKGGN
jgi:hypothetical protein